MKFCPLGVACLRVVLACINVVLRPDSPSRRSLSDRKVWEVDKGDAVPVSVEKDQFIDGFNVTISRFADGSFAIRAREFPKEATPRPVYGLIEPLAIEGCQKRQIGQCGYGAMGCPTYDSWGAVVTGAYGVGNDLPNPGADRTAKPGTESQNCVWHQPGRRAGSGAGGETRGQMNVGGNLVWQANPLLMGLMVRRLRQSLLGLIS